jgi:hypothetical protein
VLELSVLFACVLILRLVEPEGNSIINPIYGLINAVSFIAAACFVAVIWCPWGDRFIKFVHSFWKRFEENMSQRTIESLLPFAGMLPSGIVDRQNSCAKQLASHYY